MAWTADRRLRQRTVFSFYVTKNISTAEGGARIADAERLAETVKRLALHGLSIGAWERFSDAGFGSTRWSHRATSTP